MNLKLSTVTAAQLAEERYLADCKWRGITPNPARALPGQCDGQRLPLAPQRVKLAHIWLMSPETLVVESCGKPECRVCSPKYAPYTYGVK